MMKLKKTFNKALCLTLAICMALCLSACGNKPEIRNYTYEDQLSANAAAHNVYIALNAKLAELYQSGGKLSDDLIISISNFNPMEPKETGKGGKGSLDKIYDDEGNITKLDLSTVLGSNFTGYFIAETDIDDENCKVEYVEWIEPNTFALLLQNKDSYGLPEGVTEDNFLIGSFPSY